MRHRAPARWDALPASSLLAGLLGSIASTAAVAEALEEIVVTANRFVTTVEKTPLSVSALTGEALRRSQAEDITEWFAWVPGLSYSEDGWGGHRVTLRGITSASAVEPRPLSAWYLDDVPMITLSGNSTLGQLGAPHPLAIDLARIEVLRGPQGTLFGSNALGGAVRQITNIPDPGGLYGWVDAGLATTEHGGTNTAARAMLNVPITTGRAALRIVGYRDEFGGFIDNEALAIRNVDELDTTGGRVSILWHASPELALGLRAFTQKRTAGGSGSADVVAGRYGQRRFVPEQDVESWTVINFTVDYELPWAQLTSSTSYADRQPRLTLDATSATEDLVGFVIPTGNDFNDGVRDVIQELRLVSASGGQQLTWVAGAYYQTQDRSVHQNWLSPGFDAATGGMAASFGYPDSPWHADYYSYLRQRAAYGELAYEIAPSWRARIGARWFEFTDHLDDYFAGLLAAGATEAHGDYREDGVTPRLGLEYRPSERALIYLSAAQGFRPGGANEFTADVLQSCRRDLDALGLSFAPDFASDSVWSYELGAKARWLERLAASISVYRIDWHDMQTLLLLPSCGVGLTENAGSATSDGVELELTWLALDSLELALSASYIDARLGEDVPNLQGEAGQRIPTVPEWTVAGMARQQFELTNELDGYMQADAQYVTGAWNLYDKSARIRVPSRDLVDVRAGVVARGWELELYAENVFDERGVLFHNVNFVGEWQVLVRPRTIGMRARVRF